MARAVASGTAASERDTAMRARYPSCANFASASAQASGPSFVSTRAARTVPVTDPSLTTAVRMLPSPRVVGSAASSAKVALGPASASARTAARTCVPASKWLISVAIAPCAPSVTEACAAAENTSGSGEPSPRSTSASARRSLASPSAPRAAARMGPSGPIAALRSALMAASFVAGSSAR